MGILAPGGIAHLMAKTISQMPEIECCAVGSRSKERAEDFARQWNFARAYGSYEELAADPEVQLIYVASPHSHHAEHVTLCLNHGKAVLCEKAFTATAGQARDIVALSRERNVLLAEAIWTRYMPLAKTIRSLVDDGAIGKPSLLTANLGYALEHVPRMTDLSLAGGALLDLGVYPITFSSIVFGSQVERTSSLSVKLPSGVDAVDSITLEYSGGRVAALQCDMLTTTDRAGRVYGDKGYTEIDNGNNFEEVRLYDLERNLKETFSQPPQITGYEYEVEACVRALREGAIECPEMPHAESVRMMQLMDDLRHEWGVYYPFEQH